MTLSKKIIAWVKTHKIISGIVLLLLVGGGYYWHYSVVGAAVKTSYVSEAAQKGTIIASISGSGQVASSNQVDLKSKVSENVVYVGVKNGQQVPAGTLLVEFNTTTAQKKVRDAQISLDNANLALQKTQSGNTTIPLTKQQAEDNLAKAYDDTFTAISNTFLDLPDVMTGLDETLFGTETNKSLQANLFYYGQTYSGVANISYQKAKTDYDKNFTDYRAISRTADTASIEAMLAQTYQTTQDISDAIKTANNMIQFYENNATSQGMQINPVATTQLAGLNTYAGKVDADLSNLLNMKSTIQSDKGAIINADISLQSQGLSVQGANLSVTQAQNALQDAKDNLADYYVYAPFSGVVAAVPLKVHDAASSGATAVTLITNQSITQIPFNEVDIMKIKIGQKATLTFDALSDLSMVGQVADIDTLGTVTQGVVNYNVKITFDASGSQVKPGMSVTTSVITDVKQDVLTIPNSAVKTSGGQKYVQVLVNGAPVRHDVQTGLVNDTDTEITSGLNEGDMVITQTITSSAAKTTTATSSSIRIPGITGGGGGGFRGN